MIEVYFDGACGPRNPGGKCGGGAAIYKDEELIAEIADRYVPLIKGRTSNNVGEYYGLIQALEYLIKEGLNEELIEVRGDSNLVISQMNGKWRIKAGTYIEQALIAKELKKQFSKIRFLWIPREQNERADELSKIALNKSVTYSY